MNKNAAVEIETTLVIISEHPDDVARRLCERRSVAGYRLLVQPSVKIHDRYFDTASRILSDQRLALRLRQTETESLITLKGPSTVSELGGVERLEIEHPWSGAALTQFIEELADRNISLATHVPVDDGDPLQIMTGCGFQVFQDRQCERQIRFVAASENGPRLAELAIDAVGYRINHDQILHHELEIELKTEEASTVLRDLTESLIQEYGTELRTWSHSKLATGELVAKLWNDGVLKELIDAEHMLMPSAYDKINECESGLDRFRGG